MPLLTARPKNTCGLCYHKIMEEEKEWDVKRIIVGIVSIVALVALGYAVKVYVMDKQDIARSEQAPVEKDEGEIAGEQTEGDEIVSKEEVQKKIDSIKKEVSNLKPEDLIKQEPVQKILKDLENLKSSTQERVTEDARDAICDQAKRIFCQE